MPGGCGCFIPVEETLHTTQRQIHTMDEQISLFMDITSLSDPTIASNFLDMAGGDISTAVSLYYEHGAGAGISSTSNNEPVSNEAPEDDLEMANRLQNEMYAQQNTESEVRQPIMPTHDTLLPQEYGFGSMGMSMGMQQTPEGGMFGRTQRSVFNQNVVVLDSDSDDNEDDNDDDYAGNYDLNSGRRSRAPMTNTQKRLATIFRPPWDIISKIDLDTAKTVARQEQKWILINIQDVTDFRCQCLNRDFWSSKQIKELVEENFIFLQYHNDSPSGETYRNLYPFDDQYPHIAILDPMTGERMLMWNTNPEIHRWIEQVVDFLTRYSVDGTTAKVAPSSIGLNTGNAIPLDEEEEESDIDHFTSSDDEGHHAELTVLEVEEPKELTYEEKIKAIEAKDLPDPGADVEPTQTTRIQIRSCIDGKRVVKKFNINDPVLSVFQYLKFAFADSLQDRAFTLKMQRYNLADSLEANKTIAESQLKNASILLEVLEDDEE